jgi:hypothetical protein
MCPVTFGIFILVWTYDILVLGVIFLIVTFTDFLYREVPFRKNPCRFSRRRLGHRCDGG